MGFSTSGATVIVFLGVLVSASVFVPAAQHAVEEVSDARDGRGERLLERRNSGVEVANVTYDNSTSPATLNVSVNNTGTVTLGVNETDLLVDGALQTGYETAVEGESNRTLWLPGETLTFTVSGVTSEPDRAKVVAETGVEAASTNVTVVS
jgi:flagellar protein FlaF